MAASNYMTEADTESIWDKSLTTARFALIGVRIAEILNFWINDDATSQVTNTAVTPILEQLSEQVLVDIIVASKNQNSMNAGEYAVRNAALITTRLLFEEGNMKILDRIKKILGQSGWDMSRKTLPSSTTDW